MKSPLLDRLLLASSIGCLSLACAAPGQRVRGLHVESAGSGPAVVLIHGGQLDGRMWDREFELWSREFRVVRYDVRGYGRSPQPLEVYSDVEDLRAVLDELGIERASLVGLSLGGRIAIDFALTHPERVTNLVTVGAGLSGFSMANADEQARYIEIVRAAQLGDGQRLADLWLADPLMAPAMEHPELAPRLRQLVIDNTQSWLANPMLERSMRPSANERLSELHAPTLVLVGDRDVPSIQAVADKLAQQVAGAHKIVIAGAGHMVNLEQPAEFDRAALGFLRGRTLTPLPR